jgi:hypothetical protein
MKVPHWHADSVAKKDTGADTVRIGVPTAVTRTWAQSEAAIILLFNNVSALLPGGVTAEVGDAVHVRLAAAAAEYRFLLVPHAALGGPPEVSVQPDSVRISIQKQAPCMWPALGTVALECTEPTAAGAVGRCVLTGRRSVSQDSYLLTFFASISMNPGETVGSHVMVSDNINGASVTRNYTLISAPFPLERPHVSPQPGQPSPPRRTAPCICLCGHIRRACLRILRGWTSAEACWPAPRAAGCEGPRRGRGWAS